MYRAIFDVVHPLSVRLYLEEFFSTGTTEEDLTIHSLMRGYSSRWSVVLYPSKYNKYLGRRTGLENVARKESITFLAVFLTVYRSDSCITL